MATAPPEILVSTSIEEILECYPQTMRVFFGHRMACVGCSLRAFDTVGEAAQNYGISGQVLAAELRQAAGKDSAGVPAG